MIIKKLLKLLAQQAVSAVGLERLYPILAVALESGQPPPSVGEVMHISKVVIIEKVQ